MKPEIKTLWLTALRSGEFEQGRNALCETRRGVKEYCCLGVLTELAVRAGVGRWTLALERHGFVAADEDSNRAETGLLHDAIAHWSHLSDSSDRQHLMDMNDFHGNTFGEIADWIEKNL
jgi:hypothetical protein